VFWSFLYLVLGHVLRLVLLRVRGDRSKELEILALRPRFQASRNAYLPDRLRRTTGANHALSRTMRTY
jgi:hypothetical protein